ncbi:MAG: hypothetical protein JWP35_4585 [Caulobacter sp.]|nr:hypothetical protein [Caulobacter sp.]
MKPKHAQSRSLPARSVDRVLASANPQAAGGPSFGRRDWMMLGAISGLLSVAIGAFATHGVHDPKAAELLKTGAAYQFMHSMATFACATFMQIGARRARFAPAFFLPGIVLFSGSLYALALGAPRWIGILTPIGGLLFLLGWAVLIWASRMIDQPNKSIYIGTPRGRAK